jgi:hypothetical protein
LEVLFTKKGKSQTSGTPVPVSIPESYTISDTNNHDGMEHYLNYTEILDMFENEIFPLDDPDIEAYKNIRKRGIHTVVARPEIFPYNDATKWCFSYLQKETGLILNASGLPIALLKEDDIGARYQTPEPTMALNESFLEQFRVDHEDFETLMEDWFYDEEWW